MKKNIYSGAFVLFLINPFLSFIASINMARKVNSDVLKKNIFPIISLFFALIAYTQETKVGDLYRVYSSVVTDNELLMNNPTMFLLDIQHIGFNFINHIVYYLTGNVKLISLIWIWLVYYLTFLGVYNLSRDDKYQTLNWSVMILSVVLCFICFTQITEIMKQAVASATVFFAFSLYYRSTKIKDIIVVAFLMLFALTVHTSTLFYIPIFLYNRINNIFLYILLFLSFFMREYNLMTFVSDRLGVLNIQGVTILEQISESAEYFSNFDREFFSSTSLYFLLSFWLYFLISIYTKLTNKENKLVNACLLYVCILNLNFGVAHNYTRMLTLLFPFYSILLIVLFKKPKMLLRKHAISIMLCGTFLLTEYMVITRLLGGYETSFLNNSVVNLIIYPSFLYFL